MKFYVPARSENLDFFGIVTISQEFEWWLLKMRGHFKDLRMQEEHLANLTFWDITIDWYERDSTLDDGDDIKIDGLIDDNCAVGRLPDDFEMSSASQQASTELNMLVIDDRGFYWKCFPKHCNERVVADMIEWEELNHVEGTKADKVRDAPE
jgi:hypothetical protein